jgi:hypothetical protein
MSLTGRKVKDCRKDTFNLRIIFTIDRILKLWFKEFLDTSHLNLFSLLMFLLKSLSLYINKRYINLIITFLFNTASGYLFNRY